MVAKSRAPIYYLSKDSSLKRGKRDIPKTFRNPDKFFFNERGILCDKITNEPKLANPGTAGKPRYWVVNFQDIWNQNVTRQARALRTDKLKNIFIKYLKDIDPIREFPIKMCINLYDTEMPVDISNKGVIYTKVIEDTLTFLDKIPDDSSEYVNCSGCCKFIKVEREEDIKMVINIYKSNNYEEI